MSAATKKYLLAFGGMIILAAGANDLKMWEAIADFVRRFP